MSWFRRLQRAVGQPNRWMRVRHPSTFSEGEFEFFKAHCRVFRAYVEAALAEPLLWGAPSLRYEFFEPTLSPDRTVASLPLGGEWTLATRAEFENARSYMLWDHFAIPLKFQFEEGLTEPAPTRNPESPPRLATNWRKAQHRVR